MTLADSGRCNTSAICYSLDDLGLLGHGELVDGSFTDRDRDRARLLQYVATHPQGVLRTKLTHAVLKGTAANSGGLGWHDSLDPDELQRFLDGDADSALDRHDDALDAIAASTDDNGLAGSDNDYQFTRRTTDDFASAGLVRLDDSPAGIRVTPTLDAVDLISEGVSKTTRADDSLVYDREWCENMLKNVRTHDLALSDSQKDTLAISLRRYIRRIEDYRLVFDVDYPARRGGTERMTKEYATRFSHGGRQDKAFARLQQSLETGYADASTAVFTTLTTDPKKFDSLHDAITQINDNFNTLRNYMSADPSTKKDTRRDDVLGWSESRDSDVTGRPRENLDYIKVLEFTDKGYPHLHVLFFDPPRRDKDGCPWLIDKKELSAKWKHGEIVDAYPLVYRDDLDEIGNFGETVVHDENGDTVYLDDQGVETHADDPEATPKTRLVSEGFVCWYRHGYHDHDSQWVEDRTRYHKQQGLIDMDGDNSMRSKTAGSYIGKYVSKMYETLQNGPPEPGEEMSHTGDAAWWKLALYWATNRHFWSISNGIRDRIRLNEIPSDLPPNVQKTVHDCSLDTVARLVDNAAADRLDDLDLDLDDDRGRSQLAQHLGGTLADVTYLGTYRYDDLPPRNLMTHDIDDLAQVAYETGDVELAVDGDRPPPAAAVWS